MAIVSSKNCPFCGDNHKGKPFATYEDGYHCFSCGADKRGEYNFKEYKKKEHKGFVLPELETNPAKFSLETRRWLMQYHLTDESISQHGICEGESNSVFMPVYINNKLVRYDRRWINPRRNYAEGDFKFKPIIERNDDCIVLVEDFISHIRVGESYTCCCLFGTSVDNENLSSILARYDNIIIWLDNDTGRKDGSNPGQAAAKKIAHRLQGLIYKKYALSNKKIENILTDDDPKCYTNTEIVNIINNKKVPL